MIALIVILNEAQPGEVEDPLRRESLSRQKTRIFKKTLLAVGEKIILCAKKKDLL